jgi:hypothetical protein
MKYFKTAQFVPNKGQAWMYIEASDDAIVQRTLTHIPSTGEMERIPDPIVKILFMPERLLPSSAEEFLGLWNA